MSQPLIFIERSLDGKFFVQGLKYADENAYLMVETEAQVPIV
ncbi:hypothetical protein ACYSNW_10985 [Enterococcus sp. LJL99]